MGKNKYHVEMIYKNKEGIFAQLLQTLSRFGAQVTTVNSVAFSGFCETVLCIEVGEEEEIHISLLFFKTHTSSIPVHQHCKAKIWFVKKRSFTTFNFSIAFPYVSVDENYGQGLGVDRVAYLDSCSTYGRNLEKPQGLHSMHISKLSWRLQFFLQDFYKYFTIRSHTKVLPPFLLTLSRPNHIARVSASNAQSAFPTPKLA
ncbi:transcription factor UDT1 [Canna indica]|uniref:Transcription factor UDT1 n=1 Tax=Canna indica TaxID=4628 RepID=A0AAQ3QA72_9LILI|nr:transcription factor UDT1 [Canna indica]